MARYRLDPWFEIRGMKERMDKLMDEVRERFDMEEGFEDQVALWQPIADAYETEHSFVIQVELPGIDRSQVNLEVRNNELVVYGERRMQRDVADTNYQIMERAHGPFARRFVLPGQIDRERISAFFQDGLLIVTVPKDGGVQGMRKIKVIEE